MMIKKSLLLALLISILHVSAGPVVAARESESGRGSASVAAQDQNRNGNSEAATQGGPPFGVYREQLRIAKVKSDVAKRGLGDKARVDVKLRDKREVKGYISQAGESDFIVADSNSGAKTTITYRDVEQVRAKGLSVAAKVGIGVGVLVVAVGGLIFAASKSLD